MKSLIAFSAVLLAAPAAAQDAPQPTPDQRAAAQAAAPMPAAADQPATAAPVMPAAALAPQCELHVWPAERFQAMTTGWGVGFGLIGAMMDSAGHANGDKARRSQLASALDSEGQLHALQQLDLVSLLHLPASRIIAHAEALDPKTVDKVTTRRSDSTSPCYNELIVTSVFYQKAAMWGRSLRTSFVLRHFDNSGAPLVKKTTGGNGLKIFPVKEGQDTTAADAELVSVFQKNFTEAAANFAKQTGQTGR
jgi:hypothetical protein